MMTLGELSLFLTDDVYLLKNEEITPLTDISVEILEDPEQEESNPNEITVKKPEYKSILFIIDKPFSELAEITFNNLVTKGLKLNFDEFTVLTGDQVDFTSPADVNSVKIIMLGISFSVFNQKYKLHSADNKLILTGDSMERISESNDLKKLLWAELQLMFPNF